MDVTQICSIIESCSQHNVTKLKFGDLELEFAARKPEHASPGASAQEPVLPPDAEISEVQAQEEIREIEAENVRLREQELAEKLLTDPEAFERQLQEGDLADANDEYGDDE